MNAPAFGRPLPVDSLLHRRDPTVKLLVVLVVCLAITAVVDPITPTALYLLTWPVALLAARIPAATLLRAHVPFVAFAFSLLLVNATTREGATIARVLGLDITAEGVTIGAGLAMRTLLIGIVSVTFVLTTDGARLMTSMHQHLHLSGRFAYAVLAGYRLLEQLPQTWQTIRAAQAVRDPRRREQARRESGTRGPSARPRALAQAAFTLLVTSLRRGERMSIALETRGLGAGRRTIAAPSDLRAGDAVLAVVALGTLTLVLGISWHLGVLRGLGELGVFG
ncbi:energy-coupling factor transporter transmembrane component T family protein [Ruania halotolerans]|uniref:energy-coupling factor transporter transmembrane component T family protein n=1 Tax=Ruania halotolerans TaxID=2897773 RepID=UPI001E3C225F|nr:energy-coupling factor transporter transmembrane component T [Ruania halotolerans]UFU07292.1 energy-coupling factor transporter transmembrane protein EcfT [Ruania halotolerans]